MLSLPWGPPRRLEWCSQVGHIWAPYTVALCTQCRYCLVFQDLPYCMHFIAIFHSLWPQGGQDYVATLDTYPSLGSRPMACIMQQIQSHVGSQGDTGYVAIFALFASLVTLLLKA